MRCASIVGPASAGHEGVVDCKPPEGGPTRIWARLLLTVACVAIALGITAPTCAAGPREVHGSADVFSAPGVILAWGIVRGANETDTLVDIRIIADSSVYSSLIVVGSDPFTQRQKLLFSAPPKGSRFELRVPRSQFADFPRTELRFFGSIPQSATDTPNFVVFYLGIPDTTPEFASETALDAYLSARIARMRADTKSKPP